MKPLTLFYLENCPHCKRARGYMEELRQENPDYAGIEIQMIEESQQPEVAEQYDYYYVPTFYLDGEKLHEGTAEKADVQAVFDKALNA